MMKKILFFCLMMLFFPVVSAQIDSLKRLLSAEENEKQQIARLLEIADIFIITDSDSAFYYCDRAMESILRRRDCVEEQIQVLILKSELYCQNGDFDKALRDAESARELVETINNRALAAFVRLSFANIYTVLSFYDIAYEQCMSAMDVFKELKNLPGQRKCLIYLGSLSAGSGKYDEAVRYFGDALAIAHLLNNNVLLGCSYNNMGIAYAYLNDTKRALRYFNCSAKVSEQFNMEVLLSYNFMNFAVFYKGLGMYSRAEEYCNKASKIATKHKNSRMQCMAMNMLAEIRLEGKEFKQGLIYSARGYALAEHLDLVSEKSRASRTLSELYAGLHQNDSALKYYKIYATYKDSLYDRQNQINLQKIKFEYQIREKQAKEQQITYRTRLVFAVLIVLLLIVLCRYVIMSRLNKRKMKRIESDLNLKKREITSKLMYIQKKNEAIASVAGKLEESRHLFSGKSSPVIANVIKELSMNSKNDSWEEFELRFREVDPDFFRKLSERFPQLTPNDKKLCAYLKLNLSTKEIASLLNLSLNSVLSARYRLRKKLDINKADININQYLDTL